MEFKDLDRPELLSTLAPLGGKSIHIKRMMTAVYRHQLTQVADMGLQKRLTRALEGMFGFGRLIHDELATSQDGSTKLRIPIGPRSIECVHIPKPSRTTVCVSSQVGCSLDCKFCLTATLKLFRNLKPWEIVEQVLLVLRSFPQSRLDNVVFMGMGEPFSNYDQVRKAVAILADPWGLGLSKNKITVSTAGHIPGILAWARDVGSHLAVSLVTSDADLRSELMSINKTYPLSDLVEAMRAYSAQTQRKVFVEYLLLQGLTDTPSAAKQVTELLKDMQVTVNLIPFNENPGLPYRSPSSAAVLDFRNQLIQRGLFATIRSSHGADVGAACGQLSAS